MEIAIIQDETEIINEVVSIFENQKTNTKDADLGGGADWWFSIIALIPGLFFMGKSIDSNIEAWINIGKKLKKILSKKKTLLLIDKDAATTLAISEISAKTKINSLEIIKSTQLVENPWNGKGFEVNFAHLNFYVFIFKVNEHEFFIFGIKSNGEVVFKEYFEGTEWNFDKNWLNYNQREDYTS